VTHPLWRGIRSEFLEEGELESGGGLEARVERVPRCWGGCGDERAAGRNEPVRRRSGIRYLEGHAQRGSNPASHFYLVDQFSLGPVGQFERGSAGIQDHDTGPVVTGEVQFHRQPEGVPEKGQSLVEVVHGND